MSPGPAGADIIAAGSYLWCGEELEGRLLRFAPQCRDVRLILPDLSLS
jgi:hypothetical protein